MAKRSAIRCEAIYPTVEIPDVRAAAEFYRDNLGFEIEFLWGEPPVHAGVSVGSVSIHFSSGEPNPAGFWIYLVVNGVDPLFAWYTSRGVEILDEPESKPWGMREFSIKDANGYHLRFAEHDFRSGPPVDIERVGIEARIEKRLATVMQDLADHKGITIGEMLEETLLHTFEAMPGFEGQGVASPHTKETLDQLKERHGLDYDTHASYRFREE